MEETPPTDISQSHPYTCNSCSVAFRNSEAQRTHMRSDWHRYNLKRKVASLPPISSDVYNEKVLTAQASTNVAAAKASFEKACTMCQKTYFSENAYQNHVGSQKHKLRVAASGSESLNGTRPTANSGPPIKTTSPPELQDPEAEAEFEKVVSGLKDASIEEPDPLSRRPSRPHHSSTDIRKEYPFSAETAKPSEKSSSTGEIPLSRCLFCNYDSPNWKLSVSHMTRIHSLFIPEQEYLVDVEGLLAYLQAKIYENYECLSCHKLKNTAEAIQTHMRDKGHCRIAFETEEEMVEVGQFYDFSSTYSDPEASDSDTDMDAPVQGNGGVKLPNSKPKNVSEDDEAGWETDSSFSSLDSADLTSVPNDDHSSAYIRLPLHRHHSHTDPRPHLSADGFHSHAHHNIHGATAVFFDEHEMVMPSGRVAGHRSGRRYYKQNLHSYLSATERIEKAQRLLEAEDEDDEMEDIPEPLSPDYRAKREGNNAVARRNEMGMMGATVAQRRDVRAAEIRSRQTAQRESSRYQARLEKIKNSQKHFRDPLLQ